MSCKGRHQRAPNFKINRAQGWRGPQEISPSCLHWLPGLNVGGYSVHETPSKESQGKQQGSCLLFAWHIPSRHRQEKGGWSLQDQPRPQKSFLRPPSKGRTYYGACLLAGMACWMEQPRLGCGRRWDRSHCHMPMVATIPAGLSPSTGLMPVSPELKAHTAPGASEMGCFKQVLLKEA